MGAFTMPLKRVLQLQGDTFALGQQHDTDGFAIGLDNYPIYDFSQRAAINRKIIEHYYNQEIGVETISMFKFNLGRKMREIMPYWNQVYKSQLIVFDPLSTYNLSTVRDDTGTQADTGSATNTGSSTTANNARSVSSETPQTMLSGNEDYATAANDANSAGTASQTSNSSNTGNTSNTAHGVSTTKGYQGVAANLLTAYRQTLLNTDMLVIEQLQELFMIVWDAGADYSDGNGLYW